jgi:hypothetical protein
MPETVKRSFVLTSKQADFLEKDAKHWDITVSELVRRIIDEYRAEQLANRAKGRYQTDAEVAGEWDKKHAHEPLEVRIIKSKRDKEK